MNMNEDTLKMSEVLTSIENDDLLESIRAVRSMYSRELIACRVRTWAENNCQEYIAFNEIDLTNVDWLAVLTHVNMLCV